MILIAGNINSRMEWRIFFPVKVEEGASSSTCSVDIWSLLGLGGAIKSFKLGSEERRDVYVSCTESIGLKVRGGKDLFEIKVRGQKYPCGAEQWNKVFGFMQLLKVMFAPQLYS